jgi:hypothetical protein
MTWKVTPEWLFKYCPEPYKHIKMRNGSIVFVGKKGRQLLAQFKYLARKDKIGIRAFVIKAVYRGLGLDKPQV